MAHEPRTDEQEAARQNLIDAVKAWREAVCLNNSATDGMPCVGDNHMFDCPVELCRQDILAAHNKVELLRAG